MARRAGQARNRNAIKMLRGHGLCSKTHDRRHAVRRADAVIKRGVPLGITLRHGSMVMTLRMPGGMAMQGICAGGMRFSALRLTGRTES